MKVFLVESKMILRDRKNILIFILLFLFLIFEVYILISTKTYVEKEYVKLDESSISLKEDYLTTQNYLIKEMEKKLEKIGFKVNSNKMNFLSKYSTGAKSPISFTKEDFNNMGIKINNITLAFIKFNRVILVNKLEQEPYSPNFLYLGINVVIKFLIKIMNNYALVFFTLLLLSVWQRDSLYFSLTKRRISIFKQITFSNIFSFFSLFLLFFLILYIVVGLKYGFGSLKYPNFKNYTDIQRFGDSVIVISNLRLLFHIISVAFLNFTFILFIIYLLRNNLFSVFVIAVLKSLTYTSISKFIPFSYFDIKKSFLNYSSTKYLNTYSYIAFMIIVLIIIYFLIKKYIKNIREY